MTKTQCGCCSTSVCQKLDSTDDQVGRLDQRSHADGRLVESSDGLINASVSGFLPSVEPTPYADTVPGTPATTATIAIGGSVETTIETAGDHDWYRVTLTAGQRYVFTSQAIAGSAVDSFLTLRDSTGASLANDDDGGDGTYSVIGYTPPSTGTYYIDASTYADTGTGSYRILAIALPPIGADSVLATTGTTATLAVAGGVGGNIETSGDHDWYRITLTAGETYIFRTGGISPDGTVDTTLTLRDAAGTQLLTNDDAGEGTYSALRFTATTGGTYYLDVGAFSNTTGEYTLSAFTTPPLTVYTNDQIANQLTDGYWGGASGRHHFGVAPGGTLTFNITGLTAEGQTLAREAFNLWADVTGINFSEITTAAQITLDDNQTGAFANASYSGGITTSATVNIGTEWLTSYGTGLNSYSFQTYIHEIGHTLGLGHGGNYNSSASYATDASYLNDSWATTVMSYFDQRENDYFSALGFTRQFALTPMVADAVATTVLYGANTLTRTGNTIYGFNNSSGRAIYDAAVNPNVGYTIYDNGGIDTLDYSGFTQNQTINLNAESFSNIGGRVGNVSIARNTVIENAIGGSGNDMIIGNGAANRITGGAGNDRLDGGSGSDVAVYSVSRSQATVARDAVNHTLTVNAGAEGTDTLVRTEQVRFSDGLYSFTFANVGAPVVADFAVGAGGWSSQNLYPRHVADVNGDGFGDIVGFGQAGVLVSYGSASRTFSNATLVVANFGQSAGWTSDDLFHRELADVNGDGRADIIGFGQAGTLVSLARADGTFGAPSFGIADFGTAQGWTTQDRFARATGDVNGDGRADIIGFGQAGTLVSLGNGDGTFQAARFAANNFGVAQGWSSDTSFHRTVADVNGDGRADLIGFGIAGTYVALSNGDGTFQDARLALTNFGANQGWTSNDLYARVAADINHDGIADIVGFGQAGTLVAYGNGDGTFSDASFDLANFGQAQGWSSDAIYHREIADINHDGRADIVGFGFAGVLVATNQGDFLDRDGFADNVILDQAETVTSYATSDIIFTDANSDLAKFFLPLDQSSGPTNLPAFATITHDGLIDVVDFGYAAGPIALNHLDFTV